MYGTQHKASVQSAECDRTGFSDITLTNIQLYLYFSFPQEFDLLCACIYHAYYFSHVF